MAKYDVRRVPLQIKPEIISCVPNSNGIIVQHGTAPFTRAERESGILYALQQNWITRDHANSLALRYGLTRRF
jgi:hypothetical protein